MAQEDDERVARAVREAMLGIMIKGDDSRPTNLEDLFRRMGNSHRHDFNSFKLGFLVALRHLGGMTKLALQEEAGVPARQLIQLTLTWSNDKIPRE